MGSKIIVALDFHTEKEALTFVSSLTPNLCRLKIGKSLFTRCGPKLVKQLVSLGFDVFLDLKFHDIPTTVHDACLAAMDLGVWMVNVHAQGGLAMLEASKVLNLILSEIEPYNALLIAVTILTSLDDKAIAGVGLQGTVLDNVLGLASLAKEAGLDGVVCSSEEATTLKSKLGQDFKLVTPGIRLLGDKQDCQKRVMTPVAAVQAGSDYLVIGRSITQSSEASKVLNLILSEIELKN
jgi:orotidine-5'-phosphate decarboxylase